MVVIVGNSEVADQRGLLCSVYLYTALSLCMSVSSCWQKCTCLPERATVVLTVYIGVNIYSPVHVRAAVNKQKPVLLIYAHAVTVSPFIWFPLRMSAIFLLRDKL